MARGQQPRDTGSGKPPPKRVGPPAHTKEWYDAMQNTIKAQQQAREQLEKEKREKEKRDKED